MSRPEKNGEDLGDRSKIPIRWALSMMAAVVSVSLWIQATMSAVREEVSAVRQTMVKMEVLVEAMGRDRMSANEFDMWVVEMKAANPSLTIPTRRKL